MTHAKLLTDSCGSKPASLLDMASALLNGMGDNRLLTMTVDNKSVWFEACPRT